MRAPVALVANPPVDNRRVNKEPLGNPGPTA